MLDSDRLIAAAGMPQLRQPAPSTLAPAWLLPGPSLSLSPSPTQTQRCGIASTGSVQREEDDPCSDPERTPRPSQHPSSMRSLCEADHEPSLIELANFPRPPLRCDSRASFTPSEKTAHLNVPGMITGMPFSFLDDNEADNSDDTHSETSSPTQSSNLGHSRGGSLTNSFRWSSSTASTTLTLPRISSRDDTFRDIPETEEDSADSIFRSSSHVFEQQRHMRCRSGEVLLRASHRAPALLRSCTDSAIRTFRTDGVTDVSPRGRPLYAPMSEWSSLIDALFGVEPTSAPASPAAAICEVASEINALARRPRMPKLGKKPSAASIASARVINGTATTPTVGMRTTSLAKGISKSSRVA